ncbi:MAG: nucleotidyltransferase domain-containing protein [Candidatus Aenigmarchaeota archaeon]|nr:nucleotidyltransferase domain-containing protein [Candidatus Aenigmarchaeota archaeon]
MNKYELIAYASDFVSFILRRKDLAKEIENIILFGSIARGDFDDESDVDIFVESNKDLENKIQEVLKLYNSSKQKEFWELKGVRNPISVKTGIVKDWKLINRSIISDGILLYGKYKALPKDLEHYALFKIHLDGERSKKVSIWRKLYGYRQKIGKKTYETKGLIHELNGRRIERGVIAIPIKSMQEIYKFMKMNKINYEIFEIWTDSFD